VTQRAALMSVILCDITAVSYQSWCSAHCSHNRLHDGESTESYTRAFQLLAAAYPECIGADFISTGDN